MVYLRPEEIAQLDDLALQELEQNGGYTTSRPSTSTVQTSAPYSLISGPSPATNLAGTLTSPSAAIVPPTTAPYSLASNVSPATALTGTLQAPPPASTSPTTGIPYGPGSQAVIQQPPPPMLPYGPGAQQATSGVPMLPQGTGAPSAATLKMVGDVQQGADSELARYMALAAPQPQGMGISPSVGGIPKGSGVVEGLKDAGSGILDLLDMPRKYVGVPYLGSTVNILNQARDNPLALANLLPSSNAANMLLNYGKSRETGNQIRDRAYESSQGLGVGVDILTDPLTYLAPGSLKSITTRFPAAAPLTGLIEGVGPAKALPLAIGAGLGTEAATRWDVPGLPGPVEQLAGGLLGGAAGLGAASLRGGLQAPLSRAVDEPQFPRQEIPDALMAQRSADYTAATDSILKAVREEAAIRRSGTAASEIMAGRSRQVQGIRTGLEEGIGAGLTPEEIAAQARRGAAVGRLRETVAAPIDLPPAQKAALIDDINRRALSGEIREFDYLRGVQAVQKIIDGDGLQPNEINLVRKLFGEEMANLVKDRPLSNRQQVTQKWRNLTKGIATPEQFRDAEELQNALRGIGDLSPTERRIALNFMNDPKTGVYARIEKGVRASQASAEKELQAANIREAQALGQHRPDQIMRKDAPNLWGAATKEDAMRVGAQPAQLDPKSEIARQKALESAARRRNADVERIQSAMLDDISNAKTAAAAQEAAAKALNADNARTTTQMRSTLEDKWRAIVKDEDLAEKLAAQPILDPKEQKVATEFLTRMREQQMRQANKAALSEARKTPSYDEVRGNVQKVIDGVEDPLQRDAMNAIVKKWTRDNTLLLDLHTDTRLSDTILASLRGDVPDSYLAAALSRRAHLENALRLGGFDDTIVKKVVDGLTDYELRRKYGRNIPDAIKEQVDATKRQYGNIADASRGMADISTELKNLQFGVGDFAVLGQQAMAGVQLSAPNIAAGLVNRLLLAMHAPGLSFADADIALPRKLAYALDGVAQGARTGITDTELNRSILSRVPLLKSLDPALMRAANKLTDLQFGTILTNLRNMNYEGNLVLAKLTGADIADPRIRAVAASWANANTSYAELAQKSGRSVAERGLLLTPTMRRAQIKRFSNLAQSIGAIPRITDPVQRTKALLGATAVASWGVTTLAAGKVLYDYFGAEGSEFEMDPSKLGFGNLTLPDGTVTNVFPQEQVAKTVARSLRLLAEEGATPELAKEWGKLILSSQSPALAFITRALDVGYEPGRGYRWGDLNEGQSWWETALNIAPVPPIVGEALREGVDATRTPLEFAGFSAFKEGPSGELARQYKADTGRDYWDDVQGTRETKKMVDDWIAKDETRINLEEQGLKESAARGSEGAAAMLKSQELKDERRFQQINDDMALEAGTMAPEKWRENRQLRQAASRAEQDLVFAAIEDKEARDVLDQYYKVIEQNSSPNGVDVDWDAVDAWQSALPFRDRLYIERYTGIGGTETEQRYQKAVREISASGYWDLNDLAAQHIAEQRGVTGITTYEDLRAQIEALARQRLTEEGRPQDVYTRGIIDDMVQTALDNIGYSDALTTGRKNFLRQHEKIVPLLEEWGYSYPGRSAVLENVR